MQVLTVFAAIGVSDLERSIEWYAGALGSRPHFRPSPDLADYYLSDHDDPTKGTLQLIRDPERAGGGYAIINVSDLGDVVDRLSAAGIETDVDDSANARFILGTAIDPDGNALRFIEPRV